MTSQDQQDAFDRQARAHYRDAASTLSPALQGRLRAARRTALATGDAGRRDPAKQPAWPLLPIAAVAAAVFALAIGLRWQRGGETGPASTGTSKVQAVANRAVIDRGSPQADAHKPGVPDAVVPDPVAMDAIGIAVAMDPVASDPQAPDAPDPFLSPGDDALLVLEEDPDFYLWLGGDDVLQAGLEPPHDPT